MISVQNVTKRYGTIEAVKNVSFEVGKGHIVGFLGPNGAGKTTVMKILTGYHFPSEGTAYINNINVQENPVAVKAHIGYVPEGVPLYGDLTVREYLNFIADARGILRNDRKKSVERVLALCGLESVVYKKIETLSKGYKQRTGLAQAILPDPPLLILDEPTTGLDPNQIIEIRSLIKTLGIEKTVMVSTHILPEVEAICSVVLIINEGHIVANGKPEEIAISLKGSELWELYLKGADYATVQRKIIHLGGTNIHIHQVTTDTVKVVLSMASDGESIFDWAVSEGLKIIGMNKNKMSLEDIFVKLTHEEEK
ncbi:MAG: ABC transporter ATP-binding protein [Treponema sp.]|jgi:ABC-2 type transport system ATP-binding protein|nr:ABC transporter ATP-binding protein [Treponema sp.]